MAKITESMLKWYCIHGSKWQWKITVREIYLSILSGLKAWNYAQIWFHQSYFHQHKIFIQLLNNTDSGKNLELLCWLGVCSDTLALPENCYKKSEKNNTSEQNFRRLNWCDSVEFEHPPSGWKSVKSINTLIKSNLIFMNFIYSKSIQPVSNSVTFQLMVMEKIS